MKYGGRGSMRHSEKSLDPCTSPVIPNYCWWEYLSPTIMTNTDLNYESRIVPPMKKPIYLSLGLRRYDTKGLERLLIGDYFGWSEAIYVLDPNTRKQECYWLATPQFWAWVARRIDHWHARRSKMPKKQRLLFKETLKRFRKLKPAVEANLSPAQRRMIGVHYADKNLPDPKPAPRFSTSEVLLEGQAIIHTRDAVKAGLAEPLKPLFLGPAAEAYWSEVPCPEADRDSPCNDRSWLPPGWPAVRQYLFERLGPDACRTYHGHPFPFTEMALVKYVNDQIRAGRQPPPEVARRHQQRVALLAEMRRFAKGGKKCRRSTSGS